MSKLYDACIIGSGPAGWAAAHALLLKGKKVLMLDAGFEPEPESKRLQAALANQDPDQWRSEDLAQVHGSVRATVQGVAKKKWFGSESAYLRPAQFPSLTMTGADFTPSFAKGGLSTVWGCAALPYRELDLRGWPVKLADLAPHYKAVLSHSTLACGSDELANEFSIHGEKTSPLPTSRQTESMIRALNRNAPRLRHHGIRHGHARILLNSARGECKKCGLCLYGCPSDLLFSSSHSVEEFVRSGRLDYVKAFVRRFSESESEVTLTVTHSGTDELRTFRAKRLFIGAGIIPTALLTLQSLGKESVALEFGDSQHFIQPIYIGRHSHDVTSERLPTFAQVFLELNDPSVDSNNIHLQVYGYNSMIRDAVQSKLPFPLKWIPRVIRGRGLGSLGVIQGYLHSDSSSRIRLRLDESGGLVLDGVVNGASAQVARRAMRTLRRHARVTGIYPIPGLLSMNAPGRGFHTGGSFPMAAEPRGSQSDLWGRPYGLKRVHAVDASVFPTIPAATITLTVMANAHRIATAHYGD